MKKILLPICLFVAFVLCCSFGCSNTSSLKLNSKYYVNHVEFMGFSGDRVSIQEYLDSEDCVEEINAFSEYFDLAMRIQVEFNSETTGTLTIPQFVATINSENINAQQIVSEATDIELINKNGDFVVSFNYTKENNTIVIETIHTKIITEDNNGDMSFVDAMTKLVSYMQKEDSTKEIKISNNDANVLTMDKGKLKMKLSLEYRSNKAKVNPDIATDLLLEFGR